MYSGDSGPSLGQPNLSLRCTVICTSLSFSLLSFPREHAQPSSTSQCHRSIPLAQVLASPVQGAISTKANGVYTGFRHCSRGFSLVSPRPGRGLPGGRPTSEPLGSATFQTPEGPPSVFRFCCYSPALRSRLSANAIDQWFENFHHYEVTLVRIL